MKRASKVRHSLNVVSVCLILTLPSVVAGKSDKGNGNGNDDSNEKITICHVPPGNPDNPQTLSVSVNGWNGHKNHKLDYEGPCEEGDTDDEAVSSGNVATFTICSSGTGVGRSVGTSRVGRVSVERIQCE